MAEIRLRRKLSEPRQTPHGWAIDPMIGGKRFRETYGTKPEAEQRLRDLHALRLKLTPMTAPAGAADFTEGANRFKDAVGLFGKGVKDMVSGAFGKEGLQDIGSNLAASAISHLVGVMLSDLKELFAGVDKLAIAMERNTRALTASADFLKRRVEGSGLGEFADMVAAAAEGVLDRIAVGEADPKQAIVFLQAKIFEALGKARGIDLSGPATEETRALYDEAVATLNVLAKSLGLDLTGFNEDTLRQLAEALSKAGFGLDDLADSARRTSEALRNVPSGFKIALATFNATQGVAMAGVGGAASVAHYGDVYIDAQSKSPPVVYQEWLREQARTRVRGSGSGYENRGPS